MRHIGLDKKCIKLSWFWMLYFIPLALIRVNKYFNYLAIILRSPIVLMCAIGLYNHSQRKVLVNYIRFPLMILLILAWNTLSVIVTTPSLFVNYFTDTYKVIELIVVITYCMRSCGTDGLKPLYYVSVGYIWLNTVSMLMFPNGMFISALGSSRERAQWLFGSCNNISSYMMLFSFVILLFNVLDNKKKIVFSSACIFMAMFCSVSGGDTKVGFLQGSSTGIVACIVTLIFFVFLCLSDNNRRSLLFLTPKKVGISIAILNTLTIGGLIKIRFFSSFITDVLHKNLTFTNRTYIWEKCFSLIKSEPLWGYGYEKIILFSNGATSTYNMFLGYAINFGVPSVIFFVMALLSLKESKNRYYQILLMGFLVLSIIGLMYEVDLKFAIFYFVSLYMVSRNELNYKNCTKV